MIKKLTFLLILLLFFAMPKPAVAMSQNVVISEVQTGDLASAGKEFIELYNRGSTAVDVSDWKVEYVAASGQTVTALTALQGRFKSHEFLLLGKADYPAHADVIFDKNLSQTGGHIRLINQTGEELDRLGWGTATAAEDAAAPAPDAGQSLRRESDSASLFKDTDYNAIDFIVGKPDPHGGGLESTGPPATNCAGIRLNEILPNPPGADTGGGEYIEAYNTTDAPMPLKSCTLATDKEDTLGFPDVSVPPQGYYALIVKDALRNDSGTVRLQLENEEAVSYPAMPEGQAWALVDGAWQATASPTPGTQNIITAAPEETSAGQGGVSSPSASRLVPCPAGKFRNPDTNRCKSEATATQTTGELTPCKSGQERNPATNRCRAVASTAGAALTSCAPGQERNPDTNRCRKVTSAAEGALKPCPAGQTRNPDTNRCRKTETLGTAAGQDDQPTDNNDSGGKLHLGILVAAGTAAAGYGLYEYRNDIRNWWSRFRAKDDPTPTSS